MLRHILHLFLPNCCTLCGRTLPLQQQRFCTSCATELSPTGFYRPSVSNIERQHPSTKHGFHRGASLFHFKKSTPIQQALHQLKYKGDISMGILLGNMLGEELKTSGFHSQIHYLIPVPLHARRQKERGYNQAEIICRGIKERTNLSILTNVLKRIKYTQTQASSFSTTSRAQNVRGVFQLRKETLLTGKHILLVDDVFTTGGTIFSCIQSIKSTLQERCKISFATIAST